ncbi:hypothetical protein M5Y73_25850 [Citrobacter cronae]|nr:hypothetical protein [Citrobacter cronae]
MANIFKKYFVGDSVRINPLYEILGQGVHILHFSLGGDNTISSMVCECVSNTDCRLNYGDDVLTLVDSTDFNGIPDRYLRFKNTAGKMVRLFFPAINGQNKTCIITMNKINYPAMIDKPYYAED